MSPLPLLRRVLLDLARQIDELPEIKLSSALVSTDRYSLVVQLVPIAEGDQPDALSRRVSSPVTLTEAELEIFDLCRTEPLSAKQIARLMGRAYNSNLRNVLAGLVRRGVLLHGPDGYAANPLLNLSPACHDNDLPNVTDGPAR